MVNTVQQINLYLPEFRPKRDFLKFENVLILLGAFIVVLVVLHSRASDHAQLKEQEVALLVSQSEQLNQQVETLKQKPSSLTREKLEEEAKQLRLSLKARQALVGLMDGQSLGNKTGFYDFLADVSKQCSGKMSLYSFRFEDGGRFAAFSGIAEKAELIPLYVSRLQKSETFSQVKFGILQMRDSGAGVRFEMSGKPRPPEFSESSQYLNRAGSLR